jgi:hypothetical protein
MPRLLHILTRPAEDLALQLIERQRKEAANQVVVVDLTQGEPDYVALVQEVLAADVVASW